MFAYCENDPVNKSDPTGEVAQWVIGALVGGTVRAVCTAIDGGDAADVALSFAVGAGEGIVSSFGWGARLAIGIIEAGLTVRECRQNEVSWAKSIFAGSVTFLSSFAYCDDVSFLTNKVVETTMGMGYSLVSTITKRQIIENNKCSLGAAMFSNWGKHYTRPEDYKRLLINPHITSSSPR